MDCKTVMAPIKTELYADEPAAKMIDFMVERHMGLVPVTERDGTFAGLVSGDSMMRFLLPKAVSMMSRVKGGMKNASYLDEQPEEMQERLDNLRGRTIGEMVDRDSGTVGPETPLIDALMMITDKQYVVPVVDDTDKLVGAISFFSVLYALHEEHDREKAHEAKLVEREKRSKDKAAAGEAEE
ncbi:MAG: CBS domain-containing protein [Rhodospirillaceae bacterium]|jgi:CBS-domain-containing membrane protein|nr:CBS domain-containing protein [Rhodospirillaceae bacterium]MBT4219561.1 CBS domain-containing protein [Rhodospirillaceae bacterium]MBT4463888.1 CBS domain-containing protein [Rhodospirillaceae bacterium]MBT5309762.1 CBS domain-containing protein [Rhodospirillaceae bacterium]